MICKSSGFANIIQEFGYETFHDVNTKIISISKLPKQILIFAVDGSNYQRSSIGIGKVGLNACKQNNLTDDRCYIFLNSIYDIHTGSGFISAITPNSFTLSVDNTSTIINLIWVTLK